MKRDVAKWWFIAFIAAIIGTIAMVFFFISILKEHTH